ncbi:MAG: class I SAM-dependent methyltransferase [Saprospiraceae bacterium]
MQNLQAQFGQIDIYLFDQLLKGRFAGCKKILDVGCGQGRNIVYFLQNGFEVYGIDQNLEAIEAVRRLSKALAPKHADNHFVVGKVEEMPFATETFDLVICNAVLHFAKDDKHFEQMLRSIWRVIKPGGFLFCRLASTIGVEHLVKPLGNGRYRLPEGTEWYLVNEQTILDYTQALNGELFEYIKTTNVQNLRAMTTWCLRK